MSAADLAADAPTANDAAPAAPTVLVVEDEASLAEVLCDNLRDEGFAVLHAADGREGLRAWREDGPDLVVLDVMLPHRDGVSLCRTMRDDGDDTPVLFLSAKGQTPDRIAGLEAGGDDYLSKPFDLDEFLLRLRAMLRRRGWPDDLGPSAATLEFGGHTVDLRAWTAELDDGRTVSLGERELGILQLLAARAGEVVSRDDILDAVWGEGVFPSSRTVDNFVLRLRKLFEPDPGRPIYLHTVWGVGYRFTPSGEGDDDEAARTNP